MNIIDITELGVLSIGFNDSLKNESVIDSSVFKIKVNPCYADSLNDD